MANRVQLLEERLRRIETRNRSILKAAVQHIELQATTYVLWPHLVAFGTETALFETVGIDRDVFDDALALTGQRAQEKRGMLGALRTNREKQLFLMVFMRKGIDVLDLLVVDFKTGGRVVERVEKNARLFSTTLSEELSSFQGNISEAPYAALAVDCTVVKFINQKLSTKTNCFQLEVFL